MNTIEIQSQAIADSLTMSPERLAEAVAAGNRLVDGSDSETDNDLFYEAAGMVVEPRFNDEQALEDYQEFMDNDMENWVSWIGQNFGSKWGQIAKVVTEYGY